MWIGSAVIVLAGAGLGALMGSTRSCADGGCPLTANPKRGALWGGFLGLMMALSLGPVGFSGAALPEVAASSDAVKVIASEEAFKTEVLDYSGVAVVDFSATWCPSCREYAPTFDKAAAAQADTARFAQVDVSAVPALAETYGVKYIPTTLVFSQGVERTRLSGPVSEADLAQAVKSAGEEK